MLPLLLLYRREKKLPVAHVLPILVACLTAYGTLYLVTGNTDGFGTIPTPTGLSPEDFATAFVLGAIAAGHRRGAQVVGRVRLRAHRADRPAAGRGGCPRRCSAP